METSFTFYCDQCKTSEPYSTSRVSCKCGNSWIISPHLDFNPDLINTINGNIWRYHAFLPPVPDQSKITLGEGGTPIIPVEVDNQKVNLKLEYLNPTGSFKDRGAAYMVSQLKKMGIQQVVEDSSGNAGAALAAYCARAGIDCHIYTPEATSGGKLAQIEVFGASLHKIPGPRKEAQLAAENAAKDTYYASHNRNPFFLEGLKTISFEIWEQTGDNFPDIILLPLGYGGLLFAVVQGLEMLLHADLIKKMPQIVAVQAANCAPYYHAKKNSLPDIIPIENPNPSLAEGIASSAPVRGRQVLKLIDRWNIEVDLVSEEDIINGWHWLVKRGIFVELTSAVIVSPILKRLKDKNISAKKILAILTGSGLKMNHDQLNQIIL